MVKAKSIKPMYLIIIIILTILLFLGYFNGKKVYASELNEVYTLEEIYDKYDIPESKRLNLKYYGYRRTLITVDTNNHYLYIVCFNKPFNFNNIDVSESGTYYLFDETVRHIRYSYASGSVINSEFDTLRFRLDWNEDLFDESHMIIYSSHNIYKPDGTLFFIGTEGDPGYEFELNETYTIEEIYDIYDIPESIRLNLKDYGYKRTLITVDTNSHNLYIVCFNKPFNFNNIDVSEWYAKYIFDETVRYISYSYGGSTGSYLSWNEERDTLGFRLDWNEDLFDRDHMIIYSSHNIYTSNGTLFFRRSISLNTILAPIMDDLRPETRKVLKQVVLLIPIVVGVIISFIGIRKVIAFIQKVLRSG